MASMVLTNTYISTGKSNQHPSRTSRELTRGTVVSEEEFVTKVGSTMINNKIDFFRSMGLAVNQINNNSAEQMDFNNSCEEPSSISFQSDATSEDSFISESKSKRHKCNQSYFGDMIDSRKIIPVMRECRVVIKGEKCKVCGKNFKCIKDLQAHIKRKHKKRKPKKKLVLKIGNEVITRVPISRKYLKCLRQRSDRGLVDRNDCFDNFSLMDQIRSSWSEDSCSSVQTCDIDNKSPLINRGKESFESQKNQRHGDHPLRMNVGNEVNSGQDSWNSDFEDVQEVLRIKRPRIATGPKAEINHETPNRVERELLLSDAMREFIRIENECITIGSNAEEHNELSENGNDTDIFEEYCRLANQAFQSRHLDIEGKNCSFHIENEDEREYSTAEFYPLPRICNVESLYKGNLSPLSKDYLNNIDDGENTYQGINNNNRHHENNNNLYGLDSSCYKEPLPTTRDKLTGAIKVAIIDNQENITKNLKSSVLIKEEIILDD